MRRLSVLLIVLYLLNISTVCAQADSVEVSIIVPDTFLTVQEYNEAHVGIKIVNHGSAGEFHVKYSTDKFKTEFDAGTYTIGSGATKVIEIRENLKRGSYFFYSQGYKRRKNL